MVVMELLSIFANLGSIIDEYKGVFLCREKPKIHRAVQLNFPGGWEITTTEGKRKGRPGDYLVFRDSGYKHPCDRYVFEHEYERVEEELP